MNNLQTIPINSQISDQLTENFFNQLSKNKNFRTAVGVTVAFLLMKGLCSQITQIHKNTETYMEYHGFKFYSKTTVAK